MSHEARKAAVDLVTGVVDERQSLSDQIERGALARLEPADRARAQRLAVTTLRRLGAADAVLKPLVKRAPPPRIQAVLRVAVVEMLEDGQEAHGVVNAAVAQVRASGRKTEGFAGLVNAVLRKAALASRDEWAAAPVQALPGWLRGRLMSAYGKVAVQAMERAHGAGAPLDLTPRNGEVAAIASLTGGVALPTGSVRLSERVQVSELPGYASGEWWVQDAAAAIPAQVMNPQPGEHVLDLCAAPGGKTLQLAAAGAQVTAVDMSQRRMERVVQNLARCRLQATPVVADALTWETDARFDAVLLDAPCSATGTIRRHPDLPLVKDSSGLRDLVALQAALIDRAVGWLKPGGRLVYATCSLLPEEGERQVKAALLRWPDLAIDREAVIRAGIDPAWIGTEGGLRLRPDYWPDTGGMDGFYIAMFRLPA